MGGARSRIIDSHFWVADLTASRPLSCMVKGASLPYLLYYHYSARGHFHCPPLAALYPKNRTNPRWTPFPPALGWGVSRYYLPLHALKLPRRLQGRHSAIHSQGPGFFYCYQLKTCVAGGHSVQGQQPTPLKRIGGQLLDLAASLLLLGTF